MPRTQKTPSRGSQSKAIDQQKTKEKVEDEPKFKPFNKLPLELREIIWKESLPYSGILKIGRTNDYDETTFKRPAQLTACSESRLVALRTYKMISGVWFGGEGLYFDINRDAQKMDNLDIFENFEDYRLEDLVLNVKFLPYKCFAVKQKHRDLLEEMVEIFYGAKVIVFLQVPGPYCSSLKGLPDDEYDSGDSEEGEDSSDDEDST